MGYTAEQLSDLACLRDVAHWYCRGVDRLDGDEMKRAYWPDAIDNHGVFVGNAWEFVDRVVASHDRWRATMHCILNHHIELDNATTARGELYNVTYLFAREGNGVETWWGRYLDRYEKRGDEWRIIHRTCVHEGTRSFPDGSPMNIPAELFVQGSFDRPAQGRPIGP